VPGSATLQGGGKRRYERGSAPERTSGHAGGGAGRSTGRRLSRVAVNGAVLTKDEARILSWSRDNTQRLWNARWPKGNPLGAG